VARDINDAGVIVGSANAGGTDLGHAVLWSGESVQDLGTLGTGFYSEAWGVNNLGQVVGRWTLPDGSSQDQDVWTNKKGVAVFTTQGRLGLYTLTIVIIVRSQYTFNPSQSVLSKSITVP